MALPGPQPSEAGTPAAKAGSRKGKGRAACGCLGRWALVDGVFFCMLRSEESECQHPLSLGTPESGSRVLAEP